MCPGNVQVPHSPLQVGLSPTCKVSCFVFYDMSKFMVLCIWAKSISQLHISKCPYCFFSEVQDFGIDSAAPDLSKTTKVASKACYLFIHSRKRQEKVVLGVTMFRIIGDEYDQELLRFETAAVMANAHEAKRLRNIDMFYQQLVSLIAPSLVGIYAVHKGGYLGQLKGTGFWCDNHLFRAAHVVTKMFRAPGVPKPD